jgi:hypothetical protein
MPISPQNMQLLNDLNSALGPAVAPSVSAASAENDVFEVYIFGLVLEAARREGATITYQDVHGNTGVTNLIFRTSPSYISTTTQAYTHAIISFPNKPELEAHVGIYVAGKSNVQHECDVAVVDRAEAQSARATGSLPRSLRVLFSAECKFYSSTPGIHLGRGFLGLSKDLSRVCYLVLNISSTSIERLLSQHLKHRCRERVHPIDQHSVDLLLHSFCSEFREYKRS